ncbi:hypothetical protein EJB05_34891, partial [Eragrostis curvula]
MGAVLSLPLATHRLPIGAAVPAFTGVVEGPVQFTPRLFPFRPISHPPAPTLVASPIASPTTELLHRRCPPLLSALCQAQSFRAPTFLSVTYMRHGARWSVNELVPSLHRRASVAGAAAEGRLKRAAPVDPSVFHLGQKRGRLRFGGKCGDDVLQRLWPEDLVHGGSGEDGASSLFLVTLILNPEEWWRPPSSSLQGRGAAPSDVKARVAARKFAKRTAIKKISELELPHCTCLFKSRVCLNSKPSNSKSWKRSKQFLS